MGKTSRRFARRCTSSSSSSSFPPLSTSPSKPLLLLRAVRRVLSHPLSVVALSAALTFAVLLRYLHAIAADEYARQSRVELFKSFDVSEEDMFDLDCRRDLEDELCPEDDAVPCAGADAVEAWCRTLLGEAVVAESERVGAGGPPSKGRGSNALEGCKAYVSWDEGKGNCCSSDACWEVAPGPDDDDEFDNDDDEEEGEMEGVEGGMEGNDDQFIDLDDQYERILDGRVVDDDRVATVEARRRVGYGERVPRRDYRKHRKSKSDL